MTAQTTAYDRLLDALRDAGSTVVLNGSSAKAQCPAHDDRNPSLSIRPRDDGRGVVVKCHAGCNYLDVLAKLGWTARDLFDDNEMREVYSPRRDYRYPDGRVVHRKPDKSFPQSNAKGRHALFHAERIGDADTVYVAEGEKDVEAIEAIGGAAVCSAMGAGKGHLADWSPLTGKHVIIVADKDLPGYRHAFSLAKLLKPIAASVRVVEAAAGKDAADHIAAGRTLDELVDVGQPAGDAITPAEPPLDGEHEMPSGEANEHEPRTARGSPGPLIYPPPTAPYAVAKQLYQGCRDADGIRNLLAYRGGWQLWRTTHWSEVDAAEVRARVYAALEHAFYVKRLALEHWDPTRYKVANVIEAMAAIGHLSSDTDAPAWIDRHDVKTPAPQVISCRNGLLDLESRTLHPHTPSLFNLVHVPFAYDPDALEPTTWLDFLASVWDDDEESILLLQQYFGYVLSGRLEQQKLLALIGPSRSGKGTIARTLTQLVGRDSVGNPTMTSMSTNFGLSPLIGKPLAIISDARLGRAADAVVERLLSITGEDALTIDRKYQTHWTGRLPTRFLILSNELPKFQDASGVIANRFMVLRMTESFLGREDHELADKLRPDLPSIMNWSLEGLDHLNRAGRFTVPRSSQDAVVLMQELASPVSAFVRECCVREPAATVAVDDLYREWHSWADRNGHKPGSKITFGRDLRAVVPELEIVQPTIDGKRVQCYSRLGLWRLL
jgi:putative DNA primase/helicase